MVVGLPPVDYLHLMLGVELVKDRGTKEPAAAETLKVMDLCLDRGLLTGKGGVGGNVFRFKPPFCITTGDVATIVDVFDEALTIVETA